MNELFKAAVTPAIRAVLLVATGWLVSKGIWSDTVAGKVLEAAVPAAVVYLWAMFEKYKHIILLNTAAATDRPVSVAEVKRIVKAGLAPPASVPQDRVPYLMGQRPEPSNATGYPSMPRRAPRAPYPPPPPPGENPGREIQDI